MVAEIVMIILHYRMRQRARKKCNLLIGTHKNVVSSMSTSPTTARTGAFNLAVVAVVAGLVLALRSVVVYIPAMWVAMPARWVVIPTKFVTICMVLWEKGKWGGMMNALGCRL